MSNICNFSIRVIGPTDDRQRFAALFQSRVREVIGGSSDGELYAHLDDGGYVDEDEHTWLQIEAVWTWSGEAAGGTQSEDVTATILELDDSSEIRGSCKWGPPIQWIQKMANLVPTLSFRCCSTTEHEVFEEWMVSNTETKRIRLEVMDWEQSGGLGEWIALDPSGEEKL